MDGWYVLEASAPHRCRIPVPDNALPASVAAGAALGADYFRAWFSYCASFGQWFLRLWWTARPPERLWEADRVAGRGNCLLAVGPLNEVVIESRHTVDGLPHRYRIARRSAHDSSPRTVRFGLGRAVTARADEVFDLAAAAELFGAYYRTGTVPSAEYTLRELDSPDVLDDLGAQTHVLTVEYDYLRPVLATVADGEFAQVLQECEAGAGFAVLGLSALPSGQTLAELGEKDATGTEEFVQAAGSGGRYLVEWRMWDGDDYRMFVVGHHATSPLQSLKESMRQLDELGDELRALRESMDRPLNPISIPAGEWARPTDFPEIKTAEIVYSDPAMAPPHPVAELESTAVPLPVTEVAEAAYSESTTAPLPVTEAAEVRYSEPATARFPAIDVVEMAYSESATAPLPIVEAAQIAYSDSSTAADDSANGATRQSGPIDEPLAPVIELRAPVPEIADAPPRSAPRPTDDILIAFDGHVQHVYPNEVFTPAEVDLLLVHYTRTGTIPELGFSYREITFDP
ncbi:hypothetical protein ACIBCN_03880 [Nocardia sp. NPDC051052]|uniref:hypothetical protein n=1 Tax=Nocardia sp. NPDC051052 TaxID=3364322 RepID=UPI0037BCBD13